MQAADTDSKDLSRHTGSLGGILHIIKVRVMASELTRYIGIYILTVLLVLMYHCIGMYFFLPMGSDVVIDTIPQITYQWTISNRNMYVLDHAAYFIGHVSILNDFMELFIADALGMVLEVVFNRYETRSWKRSMAYRMMAGIMIIRAIHTIRDNDPFFIKVYAMYFIAEGVFYTSTGRLRSLLMALCVTLTAAVLVMHNYYLHYYMDDIPITEYFDLNGMDISPYKELLDKFNIDISRVFIYRGIDSNNAFSNLIGCRNMMVIMIGEYFLKNSSFDTHKGILLHEIGHGIHFDILYMNILPFIIALGVVYTLARKRTRKSALETTVAMLGKASLFFLIYILTKNVITQVCETRADDFARLHGSSAYLHKGIVELTKRDYYAHYYPLFTPVFSHPSRYHRLSRDGSVVITHRKQ